MTIDVLQLLHLSLSLEGGILILFGKRIQVIKILKFPLFFFVVAIVWFYYRLINGGRSGHSSVQHKTHWFIFESEMMN
jgi:hypothetical protein